MDSADEDGKSPGGPGVGVETVMELDQDEVKSPSNPAPFSGYSFFFGPGLTHLLRTTRHNSHPSFFVLFGSRIVPRPLISFSFACTGAIVSTLHPKFVGLPWDSGSEVRHIWRAQSCITTTGEIKHCWFDRSIPMS